MADNGEDFANKSVAELLRMPPDDMKKLFVSHVKRNGVDRDTMTKFFNVNKSGYAADDDVHKSYESMETSINACLAFFGIEGKFDLDTLDTTARRKQTVGRKALGDNHPGVGDFVAEVMVRKHFLMYFINKMKDLFFHKVYSINCPEHRNAFATFYKAYSAYKGAQKDLSDAQLTLNRLESEAKTKKEYLRSLETAIREEDADKILELDQKDPKLFLPVHHQIRNLEMMEAKLKKFEIDEEDEEVTWVSSALEIKEKFDELDKISREVDEKRIELEHHLALPVINYHSHTVLARAKEAVVEGLKHLGRPSSPDDPNDAVIYEAANLYTMADQLTEATESVKAAFEKLLEDNGWTKVILENYSEEGTDTDE